MVSGRAFVAILALGCASPVHGQDLSGTGLVAALRHGGYVVVMRHAHAPDTPPSAQDADPGNTKDERQLDAGGRSAARLAGLRNPKIAAELGDNGRSMAATTGDQAGWLKSLANRAPRTRTDTFVVTQYPNIKAAFGDAAAGMEDGEALVFRPARGGPRVVGRVTMDEWADLAARRQPV